MANEYADVVDLMERLGIPDSDSREQSLQNIIEVASRWVDAQTGHRFYTVDETRYYNALDKILPAHAWILETLERPWGSPQRIEVDDVLSVTQLATDEDGDGTYERIWATPGDYWLGPRNAPARGQPYRYVNRNAATSRYLFPLWEESISVTGTFGWCALASRPSDIRELTLMAAEIMSISLTDLSQPGVSNYTIVGGLTVNMDQGDLPPLGQQILQRYRGISVL